MYVPEDWLDLVDLGGQMEETPPPLAMATEGRREEEDDGGFALGPNHSLYGFQVSNVCGSGHSNWNMMGLALDLELRMWPAQGPVLLPLVSMNWTFFFFLRKLKLHPLRSARPIQSALMPLVTAVFF